MITGISAFFSFIRTTSLRLIHDVTARVKQWATSFFGNNFSSSSASVHPVSRQAIPPSANPNLPVFNPSLTQLSIPKTPSAPNSPLPASPKDEPIENLEDSVEKVRGSEGEEPAQRQEPEVDALHSVPSSPKDESIENLEDSVEKVRGSEGEEPAPGEGPPPQEGEVSNLEAKESPHLSLENLDPLPSQTIDERDADGYTPLHRAIQKEEIETVKHLLEKGSDPDAETLKGKTPLLLAIKTGRIELVELLLKSNANPNLQDKKGFMPLLAAINLNRADLVDLLLKNQPHPILTNDQNWNAFHFAALVEDAKIMEILLDYSKSHALTLAIDDEDEEGKTPLYWAIKCGKGETVKLLLENGSRLDRVKTGKGKTLLHLAAKREDAEVMGIILDCYSQSNSLASLVNAKNKEGNTPLHVASEYGVAETAELLLKNGGKLDAVNKKGETPLHRAICSENIEMIECLLKNKANPTLANKNYQTALHLAAKTNVDVMALVLDYCLNPEYFDPPVDINIGGERRNTPLHVAAAEQKADIISLLLERKASPHRVNAEGAIPAVRAYAFRNKKLGDELYAKSGERGKFWLTSKMLTHEFGFDVSLRFNNRKGVNFKGFNLMSTYSHLHEALQNLDLSDQAPEGWTQEDSAAIGDIIGRAVTSLDLSQKEKKEHLKDVLKAYSEGEVVVIPTEYSSGPDDGHATVILLFKDKLMKGNRHPQRPGLNEYHIQDPALLEEVVNTLLESGGEEFFEKTIDQKLQLKHLRHLPHQVQRSSTCTWTASAKMALRGAIQAYLEKKGLKEEEAEGYSQAMYKSWVKRERLRLLENFLDLPVHSSEEKDMRSWLLACVYHHLSLKKRPQSTTVKMMDTICERSPESLELIESVKNSWVGRMPSYVIKLPFDLPQ